MTFLPQLFPVIQQGLGIAASVMGQTYSVYRRNNSSVGSIIAPNSLVYPMFPCYFEKASKKALENQLFDLMAFEATCDGTRLQVGDILVENGYGSDTGKYCVAQIRYRDTYNTILIRVESASSIELPHPSAGAAEDQTTGASAVRLFGASTPAYGSVDIADRYALTLDGGLYQMLAQGAGTRASVPIGLQPLNKVKDGHKPDLPTRYPRTQFAAYIPPLYGFMPNELQVIKGLNADSYLISQIFSTDPVGVCGTVCIVEKMNT